jgi:hypothetical protein
VALDLLEDFPGLPSHVERRVVTGGTAKEDKPVVFHGPVHDRGEEKSFSHGFPF